VSPSDVPTGYANIPRPVLHDHDLTTHAKIVYVVLSSYVGAHDTAWPSHRTIAEVAGISESSVKRALAALKEAGLITWVQRVSPEGDLTSNAYRIMDIHARYVGGGVSETPPPGQSDPTPRSEGHHPGVSVTEERTSMERTSVKVGPPLSLDPHWQPTEAHEKAAEDSGLDLDLEVQRFRLYAERKQQVERNWDATFSMWLLDSATRFKRETDDDSGYYTPGWGD